MFGGSRWQIAWVFAVLIIVSMGGLATRLTSTGCQLSAECVLGSIVVAGAILLVTIAGSTVLASYRISVTLRHLTRSARRASAGDFRPPIIPTSTDDMNALSSAFRELIEIWGRQITELTEEQQQLAVITAYMADGVIIADQEGQVRLVNPAAARMLRIQSNRATTRSIAEVLRHHQLIELWQLCHAQGQEQVLAVELGKEAFVQAVITPFQEKENSGYLIILQDLTQIRRLENTRRDFISNISHELRTPLASLRAVVETLQDGAIADTDTATRFLQHAEREVDTLTQMVQELLELSRIESGQAPLHLEPTSITDLVMHPLERLKAQADRGNVNLVLDLPPDLPCVLADSGRIQQVMTNLLHNAIKFTPPSGHVTVTAYSEPQEISPETVAESNRFVFIVVKDSGIGIPSSDLPRIFERFYKSDRARTRGQSGTGLGLAISRHIVQAHGGNIWAKSKEGKGSQFSFSLPISTSNDSADG